MKKAMMALAALCVAGAASAITATWKTGADDSVYNGKTIYPGNGAESGGTNRPYSFAAVVSISGTPTTVNDNELINLGQWTGSGSTKIYLYGGTSTDAGSLGVNANSTWGGVTSVPGITDASAENPVTVSIVVTYEDSKMTVYFNGVEAISKDFPKMDGLSISTYTGDYWKFEETAGYQGVLSAEEIAYLNANKTAYTVPEPTALALLALGVAGLALRRKAA